MVRCGAWLDWLKACLVRRIIKAIHKSFSGNVLSEVKLEVVEFKREGLLQEQVASARV